MDAIKLGKEVASKAEVTDLGTELGQHFWSYDASKEFGISINVHAKTKEEADKLAAEVFAMHAEIHSFKPVEMKLPIDPRRLARDAELMILREDHPDGPLWQAEIDDRIIHIHGGTDREVRARLQDYLEELRDNEAA